MGLGGLGGLGDWEGLGGTENDCERERTKMESMRGPEWDSNGLKRTQRDSKGPRRRGTAIKRLTGRD